MKNFGQGPRRTITYYLSKLEHKKRYFKFSILTSDYQKNLKFRFNSDV